MTEVPGFLPGLIVSVVVGLVASPAVARVLHTRHALAWFLLVALGAILAATLTPGATESRATVAGLRSCDMSRVGLAPVERLLSLNDTSENILLFLPLGLSIGLLPPSRRRLALAAAAIVLPIFVETVQMLVPWLDRACQSGDVFDNLTGLTIGLVGGTLVGLLVPRAARPGA